MPYKLLKSEPIYNGKIFNITQDTIEHPDGKQSRLDILQHNGAVAMVPVDAEGNIWMVRQYRHPAGEMILEIPAGGLEAGEDPEACAQRELREEIGMRAETITLIGEFYLAPGYSTEYMCIYLCEGLSYDPLEPDFGEDLHVEKISLEQYQQMILNGEIKDSKSIAGLWFYQQHSGGQ